MERPKQRLRQMTSFVRNVHHPLMIIAVLIIVIICTSAAALVLNIHAAGHWTIEATINVVGFSFLLWSGMLIHKTTGMILVGFLVFIVIDWVFLMCHSAYRATYAEGDHDGSPVLWELVAILFLIVAIFRIGQLQNQVPERLIQDSNTEQVIP